MATITIAQPSPANIQTGLLTMSAALTADSRIAGGSSVTLTASGGTGPYTWELLAGRVPPGLVFSGAGVIGGVPTAHGSALLQVRALDSANPANFTDATITVVVA